ncbi:MAG: hypothetical protein F9K40_01570 [Kofleriaceae bacterium]|nr:MAG: hypothetical protein F9K40_01570 [Kofleriaceae bacterium]
MNRIVTAALIAGVLLATGCYHVTTHTGRPPSAMVQKKKAHMFLFGLVGHESNAPCPPATIETQQGVVDWLLGAVSFGLYTPYSLTVTCASDAPPLLGHPATPQPVHTDTPSIRW